MLECKIKTIDGEEILQFEELIDVKYLRYLLEYMGADRAFAHSVPTETLCSIYQEAFLSAQGTVLRVMGDAINRMAEEKKGQTNGKE